MLSKSFNSSCILGLAFTLLFQCSCEKPSEPPRRPMSVRKPIVAVRTKKDVRPQKSKPAIDTVLKKGKDKTRLPSQVTEGKGKGGEDQVEPYIPKNEFLLQARLRERPGYVYNPKGKVDPFRPLFDTGAGTVAPVKKRRKRDIPLTPLQKVELSQLRLVGIVFSGKEKRALVEDASGKGYIVTRGTYIGTHFGKVIKILKDRIIIEEEIEDFLGRTRPEKTEMKLQKKIGEG
nr:hypothetical protein [Desulfobacterales bacterium]